MLETSIFTFLFDVVKEPIPLMLFCDYDIYFIGLHYCSQSTISAMCCFLACNVCLCVPNALFLPRYRLLEMEKHLRENLAGKLEEFSNQASSIEGWLTREEKKFQAMGVIAPNLEAAMKQKPRVEVSKVVCEPLYNLLHFVWKF